MLYCVELENEKSNKNKSRLKSFLQKDNISVYIYEYRELIVKNIIYKKRRNDINRKLLFSKLDNERENILYCGREKLCSGFDVFKGEVYNGILCKNAVFAVLNALPKDNYKIKIGIYDPDGICDITDKLARKVPNLYVYTKNTDFYREQAEMLEEYGVYISVGTTTDILERCALIYSPGKITEYIPLAGKTAVFSYDATAVALNAVSLDSYEITLPAPYKHLKPKSLSNAYFASALYQLENCSELSKLMPQVFISKGKAFSIQEICRYIDLYSKI